jgi:AraC-like DNA-binding protein
VRADRDDTARRLRRARAFIDTSYHLPLDLGQIADQAFCSRYHVIRLFREAFAQTPHQYLTQRRIERAKVLLASSDLTITAICFAVGFQSVGSFSALFRRHVGFSPGAYRDRERRRAKCAYVPGCFLTMFGIPHQPMP